MSKACGCVCDCETPPRGGGSGGGGGGGGIGGGIVSGGIIAGGGGGGGYVDRNIDSVDGQLNGTSAVNLCNNSNLKIDEPLKLNALLEFVQQISTTTNSIEMQILINKYLQNLTKSPFVFLIPLLSSSEEGLIQVTGDKELDKEIRFTISDDNTNNDSTEDGVQVNSIEPSQELKEIIETVAGKENNTLIFDIKNSKNSYNSHSTTRQTSLFVCIAGDESLRSTFTNYIKETFRYILGHLLTAIELLEEKLVRNQCQNLLNIARRLLSKLGDLGQLLRGVLTEAKEMTGAERCSLFLIDKSTDQLVAKVFDGTEAQDEVKIDRGLGVVGHVSKTGKVENIRNAYQHPLFYKGVDEQTGFVTRNILCFPICDEENIIGVAELCNKKNGFHFTKCDEQIASAFSIYCGISIMHAVVHQQVQKAEARHKLSQEILTYHLKVSENNVSHLLIERAYNPLDTPDFSSFLFNPRDVDQSITPRLAMQMFIDMGFTKMFKIKEKELARFLLSVQKGYRETNPYHNWMHAFTVAHFSYCLMKNLKLIEKEIITNLQGLAFLIACFCHDLDHRGTNNTYQIEARSPLAKLYSSEGSLNERHHLSQALCLLNQENCKILDGLSQDQFKECIEYLRKLILATDLAHHFKIIRELKQLTKDSLQDNSVRLLSLMMTCCDLCEQVKSWDIAKQVADLIYSEFFAQGDLEREMGFAPNHMMDRQSACIPELQIEFIDTVITPTYEILCNLFENETNQFMNIISNIRLHWVNIKHSSTNCS